MTVMMTGKVEKVYRDLMTTQEDQIGKTQFLFIF